MPYDPEDCELIGIETGYMNVYDHGCDDTFSFPMQREGMDSKIWMERMVHVLRTVYERGHKDGKKDAQADIRRMLGIQDQIDWTLQNKNYISRYDER